MDCLGVLRFANGTVLNVRERLMYHQFAQQADAVSHIIDTTTSRIVEVCTMKLSGFMARVHINLGGPVE